VVPGSAPILIVGAGLAGLTLAVALSRKGIFCRLLERRATLSEAGAGLQIGPNGVKAVEGIGLLEQVRAVAYQPEGIGVYDGRTGRRLTRVVLGDTAERRYGAPYLTLYRADLQRILLETAQTSPGIAVELDFDVASIVDSDDGIKVRSRDGRSVPGAALVGADGLWSTARAEVGLPAPKPGRHVAYRALIPRKAGAPRLPSPFEGKDTGLWIGADAHVVQYPVRGGELLNLVVIVEGDEVTEEWETPGQLADLSPHMARWAPNMRGLLALAKDWRHWRLCEPMRPVPWAHGLTLLIGDAAHPILPFLAQGAVMAMEDAVATAELISRSDMSPGGLAAAFRRLESVRAARVNRVAEGSQRNGVTYHLRGVPALARNLTLRLLPAAPLLSEYDWLFGHDALQGLD
jgi:salicylate hydroxylase